MTQDSSTYWKKSRVEVRAAGFDPDRAAAGQRHRHHRQRLDQRPSLQQPRARHHRPAGRSDRRARRAGAGGRRAGGVRRAHARHADGGLQPGVARRRRRLFRDRPLRPSRRCDDRDLGLRQDRRRRADAARPHQRLRPGALSGHQLAGQGRFRSVGEEGHQPHHHGLGRGPRRARGRPHHRRGDGRARAQRAAGQRHLRRHVHRQHHEHHRRGDRHDAAARRLAPGRPRRRRRHPRGRGGAGPRLGRCALPADGEEHPSARHHDRARLRERHHHGLCHGRLDQHVPAPAGDRPRGPGCRSASSASRRSARRSRCSPTCSRTVPMP